MPLRKSTGRVATKIRSGPPGRITSPPSGALATALTERLIKEIKRRTDVVGLGGSLPTWLPNEAAIDRLVGAVLLEQNDEWQLQRRYVSLETIADIPAGEEPLEITQLPPKAA